MSTSENNNNWTILIADTDYAPIVEGLASEFPDLILVCPDESQSMETISLSDIDGVITQTAPIGDELLRKLDNLNTVLKLGRNYYNVNVDAVRERNLTFACVPRKGPNCVAELAMTFVMALSKDLVTSHNSVVTGAYHHRGIHPELTSQRKIAFHWMKNMRVHEITGKTLGIIGMGEIGCELARRASVMGMRNLYYKRSPLSLELEQRFDATYHDLNALLQESDYVCIATPHTSETERMIGVEQFALMKESAYLVNIARGGIVDEEAMITALQENQIAGAGLDVFTYEPLQADSPLNSLNNVIFTPHIGGGTGTSKKIELSDALIEIKRVLAGEKPQIDVS